MTNAKLATARALAVAFRRQEQAEADLRRANAEVDRLVGRLSAGRSVSRADLRRALDITGLLG